MLWERSPFHLSCVVLCYFAVLLFLIHNKTALLFMRCSSTWICKNSLCFVLRRSWLSHWMSEQFISHWLSVQTNKIHELQLPFFCTLGFMTEITYLISHSCQHSSFKIWGQPFTKAQVSRSWELGDGERRTVFSYWHLEHKVMAGLDSSCCCRLLILRLRFPRSVLISGLLCVS